jgi:hypothetical protein
MPTLTQRPDHSWAASILRALLAAQAHSNIARGAVTARSACSGGNGDRCAMVVRPPGIGSRGRGGRARAFHEDRSRGVPARARQKPSIQNFHRSLRDAEKGREVRKLRPIFKSKNAKVTGLLRATRTVSPFVPRLNAIRPPAQRLGDALRLVRGVPLVRRWQRGSAPLDSVMVSKA